MQTTNKQWTRRHTHTHTTTTRQQHDKRHTNNTTTTQACVKQAQPNRTVPGPPPNVRIQASKRPSFQALLGSIVSLKTFGYVCWQQRQTTTQQNQQQQTQRQQTPKPTDRQTDRRTYTRHTTHTSAESDENIAVLTNYSCVPSTVHRNHQSPFSSCMSWAHVPVKTSVYPVESILQDTKVTSGAGGI